MLASATLLGLVALLGVVPWRLVAAEPVAPTIPVAPRLPPTVGKTTTPQYMATIRISKGRKDNPKEVICEPRLIFVGGQKAYFQSGDQSSRVEVSIQSDQEKKPVEHSVQVKFIEKPESKTPSVLTAPRITFVDGHDCEVRTALNGDELEISVTVGRVDRRLLRLPKVRHSIAGSMHRFKRHRLFAPTVGTELLAGLPRRMERRFCLLHVSIQPMAQPTVELARCFAFISFAVTEECDSTLKLSGSGRRFFEPAHRLQQLR
jgi:hypothetical protein